MKVGDFVVLALLTAGCTQNAERNSSEVQISDIGLRVEIGKEDGGNPLALFQSVVDAVLLPNSVVVLDAAPPFVRLFDETGRFTRAIMERGQGPGEARRPIAIKDLGNSELLVTERFQVHVIDTAGTLIRIIKPVQTLVRGAAEACGTIMLLAGSYSKYEGPGALLSFRTTEGTPDTVVGLNSIRANTRLAHPGFLHGGPKGVVLYTEETDRNRLMRVACDGSSKEVQIDSLGRQEHFEKMPDGTNGLYPAEAPHPAGLVVVDEGLIWAVQQPDSNTRMTLIRENGEKYSIRLAGPYRLLDFDTTGRVLIGAFEPVPHVVVVSAEKLQRTIVSRGVRTQ